MRLVLALLIAVLLAGCSDDEDPQREPGARETPAATQSAADAEAEIREAFDDYNEALRERDWSDACEELAPETVTQLRANVQKLGVKNPPEGCGELLGQVYEAADKVPRQKKLLAEIVDTAKIDTIKVTGDKAVIDWSAQVEGARTQVSQSARRIDGEWKLVDVRN